MEPFAEPGDIANIWRPLTQAEQTIAEYLLEQASDLLRIQVPNIDALIAADGTGLKAARAKAVVVNAVKRVLSNPDGLLQEQIDDYSWRRDSAVSSGALYLDAGDLAGLAPRSRKWGTMQLRAGF
jgi:hypothetical protein